MRHKVGAQKVSQITTISYSPVIQIKLYIFRQWNDLKNPTITTLKNKESKATRIAKVLYILWARSLIKSWKHWWFKL